MPQRAAWLLAVAGGAPLVAGQCVAETDGGITVTSGTVVSPNNINNQGPDFGQEQVINLNDVSTAKDGTVLDFVISDADPKFASKNTNGNGLGFYPTAGYEPSIRTVQTSTNLHIYCVRNSKKTAAAIRTCTHAHAHVHVQICTLTCVVRVLGTFLSTSASFAEQMGEHQYQSRRRIRQFCFSGL